VSAAGAGAGAGTDVEVDVPTGTDVEVDVPTGNVYPKYETEHPAERWLVERFLRRLDLALPATPPHRILEIGMGEGTIAARVADRVDAGRIVGIDLRDDELVADWRRRGLLGAFADAARLPFTDGTFDLVLAIEVLEHLADPEAALAEIARVASGRVVLSVPAEPLWRIGNLLRRRYWSARGNTPGHVQHWSPRSFRRLVARHLRVVAVWRPLPWTMVLAEPARTTPRS
jgi:SAM-dependent methyltransferase